MNQLLPCAIQVTTEGGFDAAMEAPYIYAAIDALALRAGKWAERRQRLILEVVSAGNVLVTPEAASAAAIAAVKEVSFHSPSQESQDIQDLPSPTFELHDRPISRAFALLLREVFPERARTFTLPYDRDCPWNSVSFA